MVNAVADCRRPATSAATVGPATARTPALAEYERLRFGCSFHFSTPTFTGDDYDVGAAPASVYNPTHLDVRQWIRVAHDLGAQYAVLTAKYMSGFCLWDSQGTTTTWPRAGTRPTSSPPSWKPAGVRPASGVLLLHSRSPQRGQIRLELHGTGEIL